MAQSQNMTTDNKYIVYYVVMNVQSQNISANTSNVNVYVYVKRTNTGYTTQGSGTCYCTINGTQYSEAISTAQTITNTPRLLLAKNVNVPHNSDGTKTLTISARIDHSRFHSSPQTQSWSTNLATIPRGSKFGAIPNFTIDTNPNVGAAFSVPVTKYASSFTDTLSISVGGSTVATRSGYTSGTVTFSASELTVIYSKMTANSATFTFNLTTKNGTTTIGTDSRTAVGSLSSTSRAPTFSASNISYADTRAETLALTGSASKIIKGQSTVAVTLSEKATANKGASLGSNAYAVSVGNATQYVNQSATFPTTVSFSNASADSIGVVVTDSRGNKTSVTKTMTVVDYAPPTATGKAIRVNPDYTGQTLKLELSGTYTNWTGLSTANSMQSLKYRTRQYPYGSWSAYTSITPTQSAGKWSFFNTISGTYAAGNQYEVEVVATDRLASATLSSVVDTITPIMDIDADTRCVGIGKLHDDDLPEGSLDVAGVIRCSGFDSVGSTNFLINSDFQINQRGKTSYNASGYTVDRWRYREIAGNVVTPTSYGISTNSGIIQYVENVGRYAGQTFTFSGELQDGTVQSVTGALSSTTVSNSYMQFTLRSNGADCACTLKQGNWKWVKFELGGQATPFKPRSYAEEISLCKQYYQTFDNAIYAPIIQYTGGSGYAYFTIDKMRTKPKLSYTSARAYKSSDNANLGAATATAYSSNTLRASAGGIGTGAFIMIESTGLSCDAEIY